MNNTHTEAPCAPPPGVTCILASAPHVGGPQSTAPKATLRDTPAAFRGNDCPSRSQGARLSPAALETLHEKNPNAETSDVAGNPGQGTSASQRPPQRRGLWSLRCGRWEPRDPQTHTDVLDTPLDLHPVLIGGLQKPDPHPQAAPVNNALCWGPLHTPSPGTIVTQRFGNGRSGGR